MKRYTVYEERQGNLESVLDTDDLEEAIARYRDCWGASSRGTGGIIDNSLPRGTYRWIR